MFLFGGAASPVAADKIQWLLLHCPEPPETAFETGFKWQRHMKRVTSVTCNKLLVNITWHGQMWQCATVTFATVTCPTWQVTLQLSHLMKISTAGAATHQTRSVSEIPTGVESTYSLADPAFPRIALKNGWYFNLYWSFSKWLLIDHQYWRSCTYNSFAKLVTVKHLIKWMCCQHSTKQ